MELKAITYNHIQDGILNNKVVGIFKKEQLFDAINDIRKRYVNVPIKEYSYDESCNNYFISFDDENDTYFYTSNYTVGELDL